MADALPQRRTSDARIGAMDTRLALVEQQQKQVLNELRDVKVTLADIRDDMSEPQASPLGRALLDRSISNATEINRRGTQVDALLGWQNQMIGAYRGTRVLQTVLSIVVALLGIVQAALLLGAWRA